MGDRAIVLFKNGKETSPAVYLHWAGSHVEEYLAELKQLMGGRFSDMDYTCARFIGICHAHNPGNLSLGVFNYQLGLSKIEMNQLSPGDNGVFLVDCQTGEVTRYV